MTPWQINVAIDRILAAKKLSELKFEYDNETLFIDRPDSKLSDEQYELLGKSIEALESYVNFCSERIKDIPESEINEVLRNWDEVDQDAEKLRLPYKLDRKTIFSKAYDDCLEEMFNKAQPRASYKEYVKMYQRGMLGENDRVYEWHYLSHEEYTYILNKYDEAYRFTNEWLNSCEVIIKDFKEGHYKDGYETDSNGCGHRTAIKVPPLKELIGEEAANTVIEDLENIMNFYRFDRESSEFHMAIALGPSPTCNKETVINYWKSQGKDIEIVDRDPKLFWEKDNYGEDYVDEDESDEPDDISINFDIDNLNDSDNNEV